MKFEEFKGLNVPQYENLTEAIAELEERRVLHLLNMAVLDEWKKKRNGWIKLTPEAFMEKALSTEWLPGGELPTTPAEKALEEARKLVPQLGVPELALLFNAMQTQRNALKGEVRPAPPEAL